MGDEVIWILVYCIGGMTGALAGLCLLERMLAVLIHRMAGWLPRDLAGPEGWLIDTTSRAGVFDRSLRG